MSLPGMYSDTETGYSNHGYRVYDPSIGRELQPDPRGILPDFSDPERQVAAMSASDTKMKHSSRGNGFRILCMLAAFATSTTSHADKIYFVHNDHLGTPQVITDENKNVVWEVDRDPWGNITNVIVDDLPNNVSLPGQYYDSETGYHQNWNRDYDSSTGRYLQSDPIGLMGGVNTYAYVGGNPVNRIDPTGLDWLYNNGTGTLSQTDSKGNVGKSWPATSGPWGNGSFLLVHTRCLVGQYQFLQIIRDKSHIVIVRVIVGGNQ